VLCTRAGPPPSLPRLVSFLFFAPIQLSSNEGLN
jgi:hypothetical protein